MNDKLKLLKEILGSYHKEGKQFVFHCPFCPIDKKDKKKLSLNIPKNLYKCWICGVYGNINGLVWKVGIRSQVEQWKNLSGIFDHSEEKFNPFQIRDDIKKNSLKLPSDFETLATSKKDFFSLVPRKYLLNRGITYRDILKWKIGFCRKGEYNGRIIIPSFDLDGKINYFISRTYKDDWRKYINPKQEQDFIFNELYIDFAKPVVIVEGVFDAIKAGENSIPILGSSLNEKRHLFKQIIKNNTLIYLALDPDVREKENKIIKNFLEYNIEVYKIEVSPYDDVGEMTKEVFSQRKKEAKKINNNNYTKHYFLT